MVKMNWRGRQAWSYYRYPSEFPVVNQTGFPILPSPNYNTAWNAMSSYYVDNQGLPTFDQNAAGFTLGNPETPGFTYNNTNTGVSFVSAGAPGKGYIPIIP